jgi:hypothetical protein
VAGVVALLGSGALFLWLGSALGVTVFDSYDVLHGNESIPWATLAWLIVTVLGASFFGSWVAGHWANLWASEDATMHGLLTWALSVALITGVMTTMAQSTLSSYLSSDSAAIMNEQGEPMKFSSLEDKQFVSFVLDKAKGYQGQPSSMKDREQPINVSNDQDKSALTSDQDSANKEANKAEKEQANRRNVNKIHDEAALRNFVARNSNMSQDQAKQFMKDNKQDIANAQVQSAKRWEQAHALDLAKAESARTNLSVFGWTMFGLMLLSLGAALGGSYLGWNQRYYDDDDDVYEGRTVRERDIGDDVPPSSTGLV